MQTSHVASLCLLIMQGGAFFEKKNNPLIKILGMGLVSAPSVAFILLRHSCVVALLSGLLMLFVHTSLVMLNLLWINPHLRYKKNATAQSPLN